MQLRSQKFCREQLANRNINNTYNCLIYSYHLHVMDIAGNTLFPGVVNFGSVEVLLMPYLVKTKCRSYSLIWWMFVCSCEQTTCDVFQAVASCSLLIVQWFVQWQWFGSRCVFVDCYGTLPLRHSKSVISPSKENTQIHTNKTYCIIQKFDRATSTRPTAWFYVRTDYYV